MNHWLQEKRYQCPQCGATYLHDKAYRHASYTCPVRTVKRVGPAKMTAERVSGVADRT